MMAFLDLPCSMANVFDNGILYTMAWPRLSSERKLGTWHVQFIVIIKVHLSKHANVNHYRRI